MPAPMPALLIKETSDEAIRMFQQAVAKGQIDRQDHGKVVVYLRGYAALEAVKLDPTGNSGVAPDITERVDALEEEWRSR